MAKSKKKGGKAKKAKKVPFVPKGYPDLMPYLIVHDGKAAIDFYRKALGAKLITKHMMGDKIAHAEIRVGDGVVMFADEFPDMGALSPKTVGGNPTGLMVYVKNCDKLIARAVKAGATLSRPIEDKFYGDRSGEVTDPFGHKWTFATHIEEVSPKEMKKRMKAMEAGG